MKEVHLTVTDEAFKQLEELRDKQHDDTITETVKFSLQLNKFIQEQIRDKNVQLILKNKFTGAEREIMMLK